MSFALVRYVLDSKLKIVPLTWFKKDLNPSKVDKQKKYLVFFSPNSEDTPETILAAKSKIPAFETVVDIDTYEGDPAGYYRATVCNVANSESELETEFNSKRQGFIPLHLLKESSFEIQSHKKKPKTRGAGIDTKKVLPSGPCHKKGKIIASPEKKRNSNRTNLAAIKKGLLLLEKGKSQEAMMPKQTPAKDLSKLEKSNRSTDPVNTDGKPQKKNQCESSVGRNASSCATDKARSDTSIQKKESGIGKSQQAMMPEPTRSKDFSKHEKSNRSTDPDNTDGKLQKKNPRQSSVGRNAGSSCEIEEAKSDISIEKKKSVIDTMAPQDSHCDTFPHGSAIESAPTTEEGSCIGGAGLHAQPKLKNRQEILKNVESDAASKGLKNADYQCVSSLQFAKKDSPNQYSGSSELPCSSSSAEGAKRGAAADVNQIDLCSSESNDSSSDCVRSKAGSDNKSGDSSSSSDEPLTQHQPGKKTKKKSSKRKRKSSSSDSSSDCVPSKAGSDNKSGDSSSSSDDQLTLHQPGKKTKKKSSKRKRKSSSSDAETSESDCFISKEYHVKLKERLKLQSAELFKLREMNKKLARYQENTHILNIDPLEPNHEEDENHEKPTSEVEQEPTVNILEVKPKAEPKSSAANDCKDRGEKTVTINDESYLLLLKQAFNDYKKDISDEKLEELKAFAPGKTPDKPFIKLAAVFLWGTKHLREHSTNGRRDPRNKLAERRPALDTDGITFLRRLLLIRVQREGVDILGPRCELSRIKRYIGEKIQSLLTSESKRAVKNPKND